MGIILQVQKGKQKHFQGPKRQINVGRWLHGKWRKCEAKMLMASGPIGTNCHSLQDGDNGDCKIPGHGSLSTNSLTIISY